MAKGFGEDRQKGMPKIQRTAGYQFRRRRSRIGNCMARLPKNDQDKPSFTWVPCRYANSVRRSKVKIST